MKCLTIAPVENGRGSLAVYLRDAAYEHVQHPQRPCVLICPGGAYRGVSDREGEPVAMAFMQAGYQVCVLTYSVRPTDDLPPLGDTPLLEAAAAIRLIRSNAVQWGIDPNKITVCGFSAGGHLAGSLGVFGSDPSRIPHAEDGTAQPNAMILCYPVIGGGVMAHSESFLNLSGYHAPCLQWEPWMLDTHISPATCPAFLWTTADDNCVNAQNSLIMASALQRAGINCELHMYSNGYHGFGLATTETGEDNAHLCTWMTLAQQWMNQIGVGPGY